MVLYPHWKRVEEASAGVAQLRSVPTQSLAKHPLQQQLLLQTNSLKLRRLKLAK